jgi:hypothetical protein
MQDIAFYQEAYPDLYDHDRKELEVIKHLMDMLRMKIDRPPGGSPSPAREVSKMAHSCGHDIPSE